MSETRWTAGPWFVSGVRFRMNGGEWQSVNRYDEEKKRDENIACIGYDSRTGLGRADAHLIAAAPDLYEALSDLADAYEPQTGDRFITAARAALRRARGEPS